MELDPVSAMDETVENGVGEGGVVDLSVPVSDRELAGDNHRAPAEAIVEDLKQIASPRGINGRQAPVIKDQQVDAGEVTIQLGDNALPVSDPQIGEKPRQAQILGLESFEACLVRESAGKPALARAARTDDQYIGAVADPGAVAEAEYDAAVETAWAGQVDVLEAGVRVAQMRLLEPPPQGSCAAFGDLSVDQKRQAILEGHVIEVAARDLFEEGGVHAGQAKPGYAFGQWVRNEIFSHL